MNSTYWIIVIVLGGALVVIGNIQYSKAKSSEEKIQISSNARTILYPELLDNHQLAFEIIMALQKNELPHKQLSTEAWVVASKGNLLVKLPENEQLLIISAYQHILNANIHHARLIDLTSGSSASLTSAPKNREIVKSNLIHELNQVIEISQPILTKKGA